MQLFRVAVPSTLCLQRTVLARARKWTNTTVLHSYCTDISRRHPFEIAKGFIDIAETVMRFAVFYFFIVIALSAKKPFENILGVTVYVDGFWQLASLIGYEERHLEKGCAVFLAKVKKQLLQLICFKIAQCVKKYDIWRLAS